MTATPRVSVLMSVYNGARYVRTAVASILAQTFADFEFIIVDDASTDDTPGILEACTDPRIVRVRNPANLGLTRSLNRGLALARGAFVARQDADDVSHPERLARQVAALEAQPAVGAVFTQVAFLNDAGQAAPAPVPPASPEALYIELTFNNCLAHGSACIRRAMLQQVGGYDEAVPYAQDFALWGRLKARAPLAVVPSPLYSLRQHAASISAARGGAQQAAAWEVYRAGLGALTEAAAGWPVDVLRALRAVETIPLDRRAYHQAVRALHQTLTRLEALAPAALNRPALWAATTAYRARFATHAPAPEAQALSPAEAASALHRAATAALAQIPPAALAARAARPITIVMLSWQRLAQTQQAVAALYAHVRIPFKLLLIDNASGPEVAAALQTLAGTYPQLTLQLLAENLGCGGGRQYALQFVETEYVLFLDNDIEVLPGAVEHLVGALDAHPDVVAAGANVVFPDGRVHLCGGDYAIRDGVIYYEQLGHGAEFDAPALGVSRRCRWVNAGATLFRAAALRQAPYDPALQGYYEDFEWCYRLNQAGAGSFYRVVEALMVHHHEAKAAPLDTASAEARTAALRIVEAATAFYQAHGLVIQNLFDFIPELVGPGFAPRVQAARQWFTLVSHSGLAQVQAWWQAGALAPLLAGELNHPEDWRAFCQRLGLAPAAAPAAPERHRMHASTWDALTLPFDQYQRYRLIQQAIEALRWRRPLRILDVGGSPATLARFMPEDLVVVADVADQGGLHLYASGLALPFADRAFDLVITSDTFEHIPAPDRASFLTELTRVAGEGVIIGAPFNTPGVVEAEKVLQQLILTRYGQGYHFIEEHHRYGLPELAASQQHLLAAGLQVAVLPNGYLHHWLPALSTFFLLQWRFADAELNARLNRYYNVNFYHADNREPAYRHVLVAARTRAVAGLPAQLCPPAEAGAGPSTPQLAQLHMLVEALTEGWSVKAEHLEAQLTATEAARQAEAALAAERGAALEAQTQALNAIQASTAWRLVDRYWAIAGAVKRRLRGPYHAVRAQLRATVPYAWRRQAVAAYRRLRGQPAAPAMRGARYDQVTYAPAGAYDVVCFPVIDWDFRFQRPQQLLTQAARHGVRGFYLRTGFHRATPHSGVEVLGERLYGVQLPGAREINVYQDTLSPVEVEAALAALEAVRQHAGISEAICLVQLPFWAPIAEAARERWGWRVVYDCMDEHSGFSNTAPHMAQLEAGLISQSDLVVATARLLYEKVTGRARRAALIPNGTDFAHFHQPPAERPLAHLAGPIIGYYGAIAEWFDVAMVRAAAVARPHWQFVLIGSTYGAEVASLQTLPNVHLLGELPYSTLPGYLHQFDVACIPFKITPLTQATNPVKFFEYLSAGKPVVAVALPELQPFTADYYPAQTPAEFITQVEAALAAGQAPDLVTRRLAVARANTWEARWAALHLAITGLLEPATVVVAGAADLPLAAVRRQVTQLLTDHAYPRVEILVADTGASPEFSAWLKAAAAAEPRLRVAAVTANATPAEVMAAALAQCPEAFALIFLQAGAEPPPGWLPRLLYALRNPQIGLVSPAREAAAALPARLAGQVGDLTVPAPHCFGARRAVWEALGGLGAEYTHWAAASQDLAARLRQAGYQTVAAADVVMPAPASAVELPAAEAAHLRERWGATAPPTRPAALRAIQPRQIHWQCNICGQANATPLSALDRETPACTGCQSTVRLRAIVHLLSQSLFGASLTLRDFPERPNLRGLGMSDWEVYAEPLARKLGYLNTYYHKEPRLDIAAPTLNPAWVGALDFLISTDVFEHVAPPIHLAFENSARLLKPGGLFVFSTPFVPEGETREHFPELYEYEITQLNERRVLRNRTRDGREQVFDQLVFHGGEGETVEMRLFSEAGLLRELTQAGFTDIRVMRAPFFARGIYWPHPWSLPLTARRA